MDESSFSFPKLYTNINIKGKKPLINQFLKNELFSIKIKHSNITNMLKLLC